MIRIERNHEIDVCPDLISTRGEELARVEAALHDGVSLGQSLLGEKYGIARQSLYELQNRKCCYCEAKQNSPRWRNVEHFRPKLEARRRDGSADVGYWWLTWSWENLLFACMDCNSAKRSKFPLDEGSTPLAPGEQPPGHEVALLIDPAAEDPRAHLRFRPLRGRWLPGYLTERGRRMLEALEWLVEPDSFKQDGLVDQWQLHVEGMQELIASLRAAFATNDPHTIAVVWTRTARFRRVGAPFVALSLDVLEHHFGEEIRRHRLDTGILRR